MTSVLGIGALHFGVYCDQSTTTRIIRQALDLGVNFIDTAPMYGHGDSETFVKNAIQGRRDKVLLSTKVGLKPEISQDGTFGVSIDPLTRTRIRSSLEKSLRALGTDYIDLYQVHAFDPNTPIEETMETLNALVQEGKIRFIGCSNYNHSEFELASSVANRNGWTQFVSFQVQYSLTERRAEQDIVPTCHAYGVGIICNRALSRGILTGKYKLNQPLPEGSRAISSWRVSRWLSEDTLLLVDALDKFAQKHGRTATELAIAWLLSKPEISVVLAGMRNLDHVETNVRATQWDLSYEDLAEIDAIIENLGLMSRVKLMPETFFET